MQRISIGQKIDLLERLKKKCSEQDKQILSDIIANDLYWQLDCVEEFGRNKIMNFLRVGK